MIRGTVGWSGRRAIVVLCFLGAIASQRIAFASGDDLNSRIEKFSRLLRNDPSYKIRALSAKKISSMANEGARGDRRLIEALTACLVDDNALVRGICVKGLVKHGAHGSVGRLTYLARFDTEDAVKNAAEDAIAELKRQATVRDEEPAHRPRRGGPITVSMGRVEVENAPGLSTQVAGALKQTVLDAVEDQIEPHKPAIFPREDPDLRMDVTVATRVTPDQQLQVEVRVILVQLPGKHLRHASRALARTKNDKRRSKELEHDLALKAASRAVSDAMAMVYSAKR
jgi:hypothetical protein